MDFHTLDGVPVDQLSTSTLEAIVSGELSYYSDAGEPLEMLREAAIIVLQIRASGM